MIVFGVGVIIRWGGPKNRGGVHIDGGGCLKAQGGLSLTRDSSEHWADRAAQLGWDAMALFGCAPKRPLDYSGSAGLVWAITAILEGCSSMPRGPSEGGRSQCPVRRTLDKRQHGPHSLRSHEPCRA
jgi:hypothetical protein